MGLTPGYTSEAQRGAMYHYGLYTSEQVSYPQLISASITQIALSEDHVIVLLHEVGSHQRVPPD